jgi:hypothetical protein
MSMNRAIASPLLSERDRVAHHAAGSGVDSVQELGGLVQPALADEEIGQPNLGLGRLAAVRMAEPGDGRLEFAFGLLPLPSRDQRARIVGAADRDHQLERPTFAELPQSLAPLCGAAEVAYPLAGGDQAAP